MTFEAGARLGSYEILSALGAGGMGEVYRARDTKLGRDVALKILPDSFTHDPERLARFRREAQVLAALNHPHIGAIYGLEEANGAQFLVLELVDGETLADRLTRGRLPVGEALAVADQIANALEAAHEKGIIHRDLKPANIALTPDGVVKVLDFGLAKAVASEVGPSGAPTNSPTITSPAMLTSIGVILGTAAYMSPEQAKGRTADKRSDLWAFGCVVYEMLTGTRAFAGEDVSDTLAAVLRGEPDWTALPAEVPQHVRTLVRHCLEKNRASRIADIAVARFVLAHGASLEDTSGASATPATAITPHWPRVLPWAAAGAFAAGLVLILGLWAPWREKPGSAPMRVSVELGGDVSPTATDTGAATIVSPDGSVLAFVGRNALGASQLYVRRLSQLTATPLAGTEDAESPFFSPDGQWIAFFADRKLKKTPVTGGSTVTLCNVPASRGGAWVEDGTIVFSPSYDATRLLRVSSNGGTPAPLTENETRQPRWPQILPGGRAVLFTASRTTAAFNDADLVVQPLPSGPVKIVQRSGFYGRYVSSGHLLYVHDGTVWAAPFDLDRLEVTATPVTAIEGVMSNALTGSAQIAASANGIIVYLPGQGTSGLPIQWMDRKGKTTPLRSAAVNWRSLEFAPDGRRLALQITDGQSDIWIYEWARDIMTRATSNPGEHLRPVWTPDGSRITFASNQEDKGTQNLYWQRADGTGDAQRLTNSIHPQFPTSWHRRAGCSRSRR